ncbi:Prefoldin subunit-domain-containing protein [Zopfochytrium polystomum]|nr:Prefoldin subunit-domain-containing protein [Zopfochytrium polystomum]
MSKAAAAKPSGSASSSSSSSSSAARPSDQEIVAGFNTMKNELSQIASKLGELEMEKDEHKLVVDTMKPLAGTRKCFRLVGGVLVERTVADVLPSLEANMANIDKIIQQLVSTYKKKEEDFQEYQKKYNIKIRPS